MNEPVKVSSRLGLRTLGSFLSALAGWLALFLSAYVGSFFDSQREAYGFLLYPVVCVPFIFVVWLVALLPLYFRVPAYSVLWRWPVCTFCGATAGTLIALVVWYALDPRGVVESFPNFLTASLYLGGVVGGVTCLFGSLTAPLFRGQRRLRFDPVPHRMIRKLKEKLTELSGQ